LDNIENDKPRLFEVWAKYEDIAMHFNDLIIRVRFQALAGVAALAVGSGFILERISDEPTRWMLMTVLFVVLALLWIALAVLDFFYYNRLLLGTVDAILKLEEASKQMTTVDQLELSTLIKREVEEPLCRWRKSLWGPLLFYSIVLLCLLGVMGLSLWQAM
jgi:hypothetical protein